MAWLQYSSIRPQITSKISCFLKNWNLLLKRSTKVSSCSKTWTLKILWTTETIKTSRISMGVTILWGKVYPRNCLLQIRKQPQTLLAPNLILYPIMMTGKVNNLRMVWQQILTNGVRIVEALVELGRDLGRSQTILLISWAIKLTRLPQVSFELKQLECKE